MTGRRPRWHPIVDGFAVGFLLLLLLNAQNMTETALLLIAGALLWSRP